MILLTNELSWPSPEITNILRAVNNLTINKCSFYKLSPPKLPYPSFEYMNIHLVWWCPLYRLLVHSTESI